MQQSNHCTVKENIDNKTGEKYWHETEQHSNYILLPPLYSASIKFPSSIIGLSSQNIGNNVARKCIILVQLLYIL